jgi:hypothetical protein
VTTQIISRLYPGCAKNAGLKKVDGPTIDDKAAERAIIVRTVII